MDKHELSDEQFRRLQARNTFATFGATALAFPTGKGLTYLVRMVDVPAYGYTGKGKEVEEQPDGYPHKHTVCVDLCRQGDNGLTTISKRIVDCSGFGTEKLRIHATKRAEDLTVELRTLLIRESEMRRTVEPAPPGEDCED